MKLSVIIPVFNEVESIQVILKRVQSQELAHEIIVVDDGSKDGTRDVLKELDGKVYLIEVNDNPNIDYKIEDKVLKNKLYEKVMESIYNRIEMSRNIARFTSVEPD